MATILVEILGNAKQFKSELDGAVASTEKANSGFAKMSKVAGVAGLAIAGGLAFGLTKAVGAAEQMQASTSRMDAAFAASHVSAKAFAGGIDAAESSARKLGFQNDEVRGSLGSLVVATHDGHKALSDLSVAEDIARFKHVSLEAATKTLTMAMAGSMRATKQLGIDVPKVTSHYDALKAQFGTTTTAAQKLEEAHAKLQDKMATANLVIATVSEKLHGQADAFANTAAGGMAQFHAQLNNLAEKIGTALLPAITQASTAIASLVGFFAEHTTVTKGLVIGLGALAAVLLTVSVVTKAVAAAQAIAHAATVVWTAAQWLLNAALTANPIGVVIIAVAALTAGVILAYQHSATFRAIVTGAFNAVKDAANAVLDFFRGNWPTIAVLISGPFAPIVAVATNAFGVRSALEGAVRAVLDFFRSNWPAIATIISGPFAPIVALATNAFGVRSALQNAITNMAGDISSGVGTIVSFFRALPGRIVSALGNLSTLLFNAGVSLMEGLLSGITSKAKDVFNFVSGIAGKIASLKGPIESDRVLLVPHGQAIIQGLQAGIESGLDSLNRMTASIAPSVSATIAAAPLGSPTSGGGGVVGGGGTTIHVTVNGWVGNDQAIAEKIRNEVIRLGRRTTGGAFGGYA